MRMLSQGIFWKVVRDGRSLRSDYAKDSKIRCLFWPMSWLGVNKFGYSGADVARYLGVTNSCVT